MLQCQKLSSFCKKGFSANLTANVTSFEEEIFQGGKLFYGNVQVECPEELQGREISRRETSGQKRPDPS